jgi:hypothetical protein
MGITFTLDLKFFGVSLELNEFVSGFQSLIQLLMSKVALSIDKPSHKLFLVPIEKYS